MVSHLLHLAKLKQMTEDSVHLKVLQAGEAQVVLPGIISMFWLRTSSMFLTESKVSEVGSVLTCKYM